MHKSFKGVGIIQYGSQKDLRNASVNCNILNPIDKGFILLACSGPSWNTP